MSMHDRATAAVLTQLMMAADGALFGIGVAYVAYRCIRKYTTTSSALRKIRDAPVVNPSDLRSVIYDGSPPSLDSDGGKLVILRGSVDVLSAEKASWKTLMDNNAVPSKDSAADNNYVILQRKQTYIYNEWKGVFSWSVDLRDILSLSLKERETSSTTTMVPFVLVEGKKWPDSDYDYVFVNMEGSNHPLPLTTVHQKLHPISSTPYTFLQAIFGLEYPVGLLYEEKILPVRKYITAVGSCYPKDGAFEIKSCKDIPYFLSTLSKDKIVADLTFKSKVLMWSGLIIGTIAMGILGYSVRRNWIRWTEYRRRQQLNNSTSDASDSSADVVADEEPEEIPDGELCVICLIRRKRSAFVPCGHLVCCQRCALVVERDMSPKCPLCRQTIRSSVRIYDS